MKTKARREAAKARAELYAPKPRDSRLIYAVVTVSVLLMGMVAIGTFYDVDLSTQPVVVVLLIMGASAAGLLIRRFRMHRHQSARQFEYDRHHPGDVRRGHEDIRTAEG